MMTEAEVASLVVGSRFVKCDYDGPVYTVTKLYLGVSVCFVSDNGDADEWPLASMRAHCALHGAIASIRALYDRPERSRSSIAILATTTLAEFTRGIEESIRAIAHDEAEFRATGDAYESICQDFIKSAVAKAQREALSAAIRVEDADIATNETRSLQRQAVPAFTPLQRLRGSVMAAYRASPTNDHPHVTGALLPAFDRALAALGCEKVDCVGLPPLQQLAIAMRGVGDHLTPHQAQAWSDLAGCVAGLVFALQQDATPRASEPARGRPGLAADLQAEE